MDATQLLKPRARKVAQWARKRSGLVGRSGRTVEQLEQCLSLNQLQRFEVLLHRHGRALWGGMGGGPGGRGEQLEQCLSLTQLRRFEVPLTRRGRSLWGCASIFEFGC